MTSITNLNKISRILRQRCGYRKQLLCASAIASILAFPAVAEETQKKTEAEKKKANTEVEVIEVHGLRGTMTRSLNEKKNSVAIVDAVAAADFGELPGLSLSDVIENIPGATGHRLKGSQNEISIRGLGSYWGYSTFNGRTITNAGPGRAVNFKKFPSELVDKVVIYKSQQADLVEGGTSGTIDVNSLRAVDYGKAQTTVDVRGIYNSYYQDVDGDVTPWGSKITASTVQQWETENLGDMGFTLGLTHTRSANPEENYGGSSQMGVCALRAADGTALIGGSNCATGQQGVSAGRVGREPELGVDTNLADFDQTSIFYVPNDAYWRTVEDEDIRSGAVFTFQWLPNDKLNINFDYEHSDLEYTEKRMELALDSRLYNLADHIVSSDHTLLYVTGEARPTLQGENRNQVDEYRGGGLEIDYSVNDDLSFNLDVSYSKSYRYRLRHRTKFRATDRYNYALDFRGRNVPTLTWLDNNRLGPDDAGFASWEAFDASDMHNFLNDDGHAYVEYRRTHEHRDDKIWAVDFNGKYHFDNPIFSSVKAGVRYSKEHLLDFVNNDVSLVIATGEQKYGASDNEDNNWDELNPEADLALINGIIDNCTNNHSNNIQFAEEPGQGGDATRYATYDSKCFIGQILGQLPGATSTDFYDIGERADGRDGGDRDVTETITAAYVMGNIDTEIAGMPVYGNLGVRVVKTDTHSDGWGDKVYITSHVADDDSVTWDAVVNPTGEIEAVTLDSSYTRVLPSLNLTFHVTDEFYVRTAAYRSMSRFQLNAMSAGVSYQTCENEDDTICDPATNSDFSQVVRSGNANGNHLDPYMATNFDLSLEYYPSQDAMASAAFYYKSFTGGYDVTTEYRDIIVNLDGQDITYPNVAHQVKQTSKDTSIIKGIEITAQKQFVELPEPFNGLGAKMAWNYADSNFVTAEPASPGIVPDANLFGFSRNVASASIYWEGDNTTVRLLWKYRSKYFQPNNLPFPDRSNRYVQDASYVDFSAKYKINSKVSVFLKGLNLTNTPQVMTRGNDTTIADYSRSGTKWEIGVKAKF
jgi:TonB-dependent receptor